MSDSARTETIGDLRIDVWRHWYQPDDKFWKYQVFDRFDAHPLLEGERIASEGEK